MDTSNRIALEEVEAGSFRITENNPGPTKFWSKNPWQAHTRKIFLACGIVVIPMIVFTIAIIWVVFANLIDDNRCLHPELCPGPEILNASRKDYYYVDYPAARLVFISSWSSTISLSFVSMLMTLFAYLIANQMLRTSSGTTDQSNRLPSPYQTSLLMRILNADLLALWDLGAKKAKNIFWEKQRSSESEDARPPPILRTSILVFLLCLFGSILVQAADTYLHVTTESADLVQIETQDSQQYLYSRGLAPWCLDRPKVGSSANVNFWGCGVKYDGDLDVMALNNMTLYNEVGTNGPKVREAIYNYTGSNGLQFALVGPYDSSSENDWIATTIGVSTKCSAVPHTACTRGDAAASVRFPGEFNQPFNCTSDKAGFDVAGNNTAWMHDIYYFDFHKYLRDSRPFSVDIRGWEDKDKYAVNVSDDEEVFRNPWMTLSQATMWMDRSDYSVGLNNSATLWPSHYSPFDFTMLLCNTTVWDITYTAIGRTIASLSATKSNGSVAGIASMPGLSTPELIANQYDTALQYASSSATSMQAFIDSYAAGLSKVRSYSLATQMSPRPALLAQTRISNVITKVPVAALWLLVLANLLYALLGIGLTTLALIYTSPNVHQVFTRLSITGIVAQLFEREYAERAVESEEKLFRENVEKDAEIKRVGVRRTDTGGSMFAVSEKIAR